MLDNDLIRVFLPILNDGLLSYGLTTVTTRQAYQPVQAGTETNPVVTFFKVSDKRYGWPRKYSFYDGGALAEKHTERQVYESVFQLNSLSTQNPTDVNSLTASDIINTCSAIMQSDATIERLKNQDVGILRVTDIRNLPFTDDRDQFEFSPSFDFTLRHIQERTITIEYFSDIKSGLYRV